MKEIALIGEVKKILTANEKRRRRYAGDLELLDTRYNQWVSDRIRVGVIGVTSSGKSTLINAILGDDLLSVAVRPSSSQLVSCSYAKERSAVVYFLNGSKKNIKDNAQLKNAIVEYSDESKNRNNQKQVAQLELSTPNFALGEDVLLIDSPGLDASGYEAHERLTLETLLPSVDVVIFVTTVKSEVDRKMKLTFDTIAKYNCPVMVVQNMLDAVRPSIDGKKSAADVAKERLIRVLHAVEQSDIRNKSEVKVSQISAIFAMRYRCNPMPTETDRKAYKVSHYDDFVDGVKDLIKTKRPGIESQRVTTILSYIENLIQQENKRIGNVTSYVTVDNSLSTVSDEISDALDSTYDDIQNVVDELSEMYDKYFSEDDSSHKGSSGGFFGILSAFYSHKKTLGENDISDIKRAAGQFEARVIESVRNFSARCSAIISKLNMPARDLWSYNGLPRMPEVSVKTKIVERSRTVKKKGFINSIKRFFDWGDRGWGTETEYYTETVTDDEATLESAKRYIERLQFEYGKTLEAWYTNAQSTVDSIKHEVDLRIEAIREKEQQILDANDWLNTRAELEKCIAQYRKKFIPQSENAKKHVSQTIKVQDNTKLIKAPQRMAQIHDAAEKYLHAIQKSTIGYAIQAKERSGFPTAIVSNSPDNLSEFLYRFYKIKKTDFEKETVYQLTDNLCAACSPTEYQLKSMTQNADSMNVFLLINGNQFHTEFEASLRHRVQEALLPNAALFLVIHDFEILANGDAITECIRTVRTAQYSDIAGTNGMTLICHKNPVYNMAIIHAQTNDVQIKEEAIFINSLTKRFPSLVNEVIKKRINNILRS